MKLGFVSAILADLDLEAVLSFAKDAGYDTVELMCWPAGKADRRYAGVTHIDVSNFTPGDAQRVLELSRKFSVGISGLGYYPNPLVADTAEAAVYLGHIKKVIAAASLLGVNQMNTFIGRDPSLSEERNWQLVEERWPAIVREAEARGVRIGIENCPMFFTKDEWPGGKNLAVSPRAWRRLFGLIPSSMLGLNYDPSHLVWQQMDYTAPLSEFRTRLFHVHAKDAKVDRERLNDVGILATPLEYHEPKLPGGGDIDWPRFFHALGEAGYSGPVCVELEDRAFENTLEARKDGLLRSAAFLRPFITP